MILLEINSEDLKIAKFSEGIYNAYDRIGIAVICAAMIVTAIGSAIRDRVTA